ncbi:MAG: formylglycine-generating enzyme family protein, partial [Saprospiraceae bacterium]|nr:formylglycine-generating enzyme family protein [Saprospiraceae bacterium]
YDALEYCNWLSERLGLKPCYRINKETGSDADNRVANDYLKWKVETDPQANGFRLPTEAEWEYAARGGQQSKGFVYAGSNTPGEVAWYWGNSGDVPLSGKWDFQTILDNNGRTHPVRSKNIPNELGLFDMSGNVYEWCWDWYDAGYYDVCMADGVAADPTGPTSGESGRVLRGGSWFNVNLCRVAFRDWCIPFIRDYIVGVRLAQGYTYP